MEISNDLLKQAVIVALAGAFGFGGGNVGADQRQRQQAKEFADFKLDVLVRLNNIERDIEFYGIADPRFTRRTMAPGVAEFPSLEDLVTEMREQPETPEE